jgi:hypothetical protein
LARLSTGRRGLIVAIDLREARQERAARNQSLFRDVNEQLEMVMRELDGEQDFLCECSDRECNEMVSLSVSEYERVRSVATHFAIAPGHELAQVECVVMRANGRFIVVEKIERAAEIARLLDPRDGVAPPTAGIDEGET